MTFADGSQSTGSYYENAAFNPSMLPLQAALVHQLVSKASMTADVADKDALFRSITQVILLERRIGAFSLRSETSGLVEAIAPAAVFAHFTIA